MNAVDRRQEINLWLKALLITTLFFALFMMMSDVYASDGKEFEKAVETWNNWVKGNLGKLAALIALGVGAIVAAVKKDWSWFFGAVVLSMGVGVMISIINISFTATT